MLRLRRLAEPELPTLHRWYQTPALWDHLVGEFQLRTEAEAVAYMRRWLTPSEVELRLAIEDDGSLTGLVALAPIDPAGGEAEFHIFLGEAASRGAGRGREATRLMLEEAFGPRRLQRVWLRVLERNAPARKVYERLGFVETGRERAAKAGAEVEVVAMAVTAEAFRAGQASATT